MSDAVAAVPPAQAPARPRLTAQDREFLPAALELLDTPPSPIRMGVLLTICGFVTAALVWSFVGKIDIVSIAQGKIQSVGRVKLVQPVETGRVRILAYANGDHVQAGDVILELDDGEAKAEMAELGAALAASRAESLRRMAAIDAGTSRRFGPPAIAWPPDIPANVVLREERVLAADLSQVSSALASFAAQREQKTAEQARLRQTIGELDKLLTIEGERVSLRSGLESKGLGSRLSSIDAKETMQQQRGSLAQQKGQFVESVAASLVLERDAAKTVDAFVAENGQKLADAEKLVEETTQRLSKSRAHAEHMVLRAPVAGLIQGLTVVSPGQVVMSGEEIMRVVPDDGGYEIEAYMPNRDIGFVMAGQEAVVKIESYPFTRYGSLQAEVIRVGKDAIPEPEAAQKEGDPAKSSRSSFAGGAERVQNLVFPVTLKPVRNYIGDDPNLGISNGMAATIEIKTGQRRIIDYVFSPLVEVGSRALKER